MPEQEGAPSPEGVAQTDSPDVDSLRSNLEQAQARLKELEIAREQDVSQLRSSLDQRYGQELAERDRRIEETERRMHEAAMSTMDEQERVTYRLQVAEDTNARLQTQLQEERFRNQAQSQVGQYAADFMKMGVPMDKLNWADPNQMWSSGWEALKEVRKAEAEELERFKSQQPTDEPLQEPTADTPRRTPVVTQHGPQASGGKTMSSVIQSLEAQFGQKFDAEKVFTWIEQRHIDANILEGIDWSKG
jgi:exonuclease VII large subunit